MVMCGSAKRLLVSACVSWVLAFGLNAAAEISGVINLTNRNETLTNLQGQVYSNVDLVRADLDGVVYRSESGGGRISYTNLSPARLETLGIPTNRIAVAAERAAMNAEQRKADYEHRLEQAAANQQQAEKRMQAQAQAQAAAAKAKGDGSATGAPTAKHGHKKYMPPPGP
jgi:regulator of protease activity HflC (stomatin/prohibitin superfamily)